jgi:hypothetical protein
VERIEAWAFCASGLKSVQADGSPLEIGAGAFVGCTSLAETSFAPAKLGVVVFAGCCRLSVLTIQRINAYRPITLCGSNVSRIRGYCSGCNVGTLFDVLTPPSAGSIEMEWDAARREGIVPMTSLTVRGGSCVIEEPQRRMLSEVDLIALKDLPEDATFSRSFFLIRIRLPLKLTTIPAGMFSFCQRLAETNICDCIELREIGNAAFLHCWALYESEIPAQCRVVNVDHCGVQRLHLRGGNSTAVNADNCAFLKTLILPRAFGGGLNIRYDISLKSLTFGGIFPRVLCADMHPNEVRCLGVRSPFCRNTSALLSRARVLGELAAVNRQPGVPLLPC